MPRMDAQHFCQGVAYVSVCSIRLSDLIASSGSKETRKDEYGSDYCLRPILKYYFLMLFIIFFGSLIPLLSVGKFMN